VKVDEMSQVKESIFLIYAFAPHPLLPSSNFLKMLEEGGLGALFPRMKASSGVVRQWGRRER